MARPKKPISADQVIKLATLGLTVTEIADFLGVDRATLYRRFATEISKGHGELKMKLRRLQLRAAERGSVAMLIFLGKVILQQRETPDQEGAPPTKVEIIFECPNENTEPLPGEAGVQDRPTDGE